ncbi:MAG: cytochrome oxidase assembly protein [Candidatus Competibacteraceae bacterium]|nr:cytochrome oxidase assembly protein [Candidatus Competibacteraceae bacterium]
MNVRSMSSDPASVPAAWRQRLVLLAIIACFVLPLAAAWLSVGHWRPDGSVQHGELLNPARPLELRFEPASEADSIGRERLRGRWVLVYVGSADACDARCRTGLYDMRQVRLALGKDIDRIKTLLLLDARPTPEWRQWLSAEHAATVVGVADDTQRTALLSAFPRSGQAGDWVYLLDPLGNLLMRYPVDVEPRGILKDLQRLLKWSKIG